MSYTFESGSLDRGREMDKEYVCEIRFTWEEDFYWRLLPKIAY